MTSSSSTSTPSPSDTSDIPPTMRAWTYTHRGPLSKVLTLTTTHPTPNPSTLGPNEVLIKIAYTAFTPSASAIIPYIPASTRSRGGTPAIPELEFSGTIVALGNDVSTTRPELKPSTRVFGGISLAAYFKGLGTVAEYVPCEIDRVGIVPDSVQLSDAAALAGNGITAVQVIEALAVKKGNKVLVNGGSGATGTMLVQCLKGVVGESGCVVVSCSGGSEGMVRALGADEIIDYRQHNPLHAYLSQHHTNTRFDAIVDTVGIQSLYTHSPSYLREGGRFVNIGAMLVQSGQSSLSSFVWAQLVNNFWPRVLGGTPRWYQMVFGDVTRSRLDRAMGLLVDGTWKGVVDSVWGMEDVLEAYEKLHSQRAKGTVLIRVERSSDE